MDPDRIIKNHTSGSRNRMMPLRNSSWRESSISIKAAGEVVDPDSLQKAFASTQFIGELEKRRQPRPSSVESSQPEGQFLSVLITEMERQNIREKYFMF